MKFKKKGVSSVVATMLLIMLTIVSISILYSFVVPFVKKSLKSTDCFEFRSYYKFDDSFGYNCYTENGIEKSYLITLKADSSNTDKQPESLSLRFFKSSGVTVLNIKNGDTQPDIKMLDPSLTSLIIPSSGSYPLLSYVYTSDELYTKVEVYPVLTDNKVCDKSDSVKIIKCGS